MKSVRLSKRLKPRRHRVRTNQVRTNQVREGIKLVVQMHQVVKIDRIPIQMF